MVFIELIWISFCLIWQVSETNVPKSALYMYLDGKRGPIQMWVNFCQRFIIIIEKQNRRNSISNVKTMLKIYS